MSGARVPPLTAPASAALVGTGDPAAPRLMAGPKIPPAPEGSPVPPTRLIVVVPDAVTHEICVAAPTEKANQPPFGAMYCCVVEDDAPRAQKAPCEPPTLVATTVT